MSLFTGFCTTEDLQQQNICLHSCCRSIWQHVFELAEWWHGVHMWWPTVKLRIRDSVRN